jgi:hypothetical protein
VALHPPAPPGWPGSQDLVSRAGGRARVWLALLTLVRSGARSPLLRDAVDALAPHPTRRRDPGPDIVGRGPRGGVAPDHGPAAAPGATEFILAFLGQLAGWRSASGRCGHGGRRRRSVRGRVSGSGGTEDSGTQETTRARRPCRRRSRSSGSRWRGTSSPRAPPPSPGPPGSWRSWRGCRARRGAHRGGGAADQAGAQDERREQNRRHGTSYPVF